MTRNYMTTKLVDEKGLEWCVSDSGLPDVDLGILHHPTQVLREDTNIPPLAVASITLARHGYPRLLRSGPRRVGKKGIISGDIKMSPIPVMRVSVLQLGDGNFEI